MTLAVVIPCYNGWKYFDRCLKSLEKQKNNIDEIIIVDDCSTDNSFEQLHDYATKSKLNIKLIQNSKNLGPGESRKNGLKLVESDYVAFCDCDDWYEIDFAEQVKTTVVELKCDLLLFDSYTAFDEKNKKIDHITTNLVGKDKKTILAYYPMSLCRLIVNKNLFHNIVHSGLRHGEDGVLVAQLLSKANKIEVLDKPFYNYYYREDSVSKMPSTRAVYDMYEAFKIIYHNVSKEYNDEIEFMGINYICYGGMLCGAKTKVDSASLKTILIEFEKMYPNWKKNKYINSLGFIKRQFVNVAHMKWFWLLRIMVKLHPLFAKK